MVQTTLNCSDSVAKPTSVRKSYTREFKLEVIRFYRGSNLYQTSKHFALNTKTIGRWVADEAKITKSSKVSKRVKFSRKCRFPELEEALYDEYKKLCKQGIKVKGFWFKTRAKQLLEKMEPGTNFKFSNAWFTGFKSRHRISLRRVTNVSQRPPSDKREAIQLFHHSIRRLAAEPRPMRPTGKYSLAQIANVDQTPLPFAFTLLYSVDIIRMFCILFS